MYNNTCLAHKITTCTPGKPSGLSVHHAVPVEVVGGAGQQQHQQHHQLGWPEPRPLIPRAQHRVVQAPRHPTSYSAYLPDDGRSPCPCSAWQTTPPSFLNHSSTTLSFSLLFQMMRLKSPLCKRTNLLGWKPKPCDMSNQVPDRDNRTQEELKRSSLLQKVFAYKASTLSICDIIKYTQEDTICLPVWFVCLFVNLLVEEVQRVDEQVGQKQGNPMLHVHVGLRNVAACIYTRVHTCVYLHATYVGMGLPCGPTHISVVSVYQCAVWYLPSVVSWREINPLIFPSSLIFPDRLDPWDKNPTGISLSIVRTGVHVLNRCCQYHQGIQTGTLIWGSDIHFPHYGTGPAFEGCRSGSVPATEACLSTAKKG